MQPDQPRLRRRRQPGRGQMSPVAEQDVLRATTVRTDGRSASSGWTREKPGSVRSSVEPAYDSRTYSPAISRLAGVCALRSYVLN